MENYCNLLYFYFVVILLFYYVMSIVGHLLDVI